MSIDQESSAVARAHVKAYSNHDYEMARRLLADDVHFTVITTGTP